MAAKTAKPLIIAHRGVHTRERENSLAALEAAIAQSDGFETDLWRTADGVLVLAHDREAPDGWAIPATGYRELNALYRQAGLELATLEQLLAIADPAAWACLELKAAGLGAEVFRRAWPIFGTRLRILSFEPAWFADVPEVYRWLNIRGSSEIPSRLAGFVGLNARADAYPFELTVPERAAWRVAPDQLPVLLADRVRYLITDDPDGVRQALERLTR
jgi:glycerophosphoryl diester phosphodiesterase